MKVAFNEEGWSDYLYWAEEDRQTLRRINRLIEAARRDPKAGIGKPEPLRFQFAGAWSRRITQEHRLVYVPTDGEILIIAARYHYDVR